MEVLKELISSIEDKPVKDLIVGAFITMVKSERIGCASTVMNKNCSKRDFRNLISKSLKELAELSLSEDTIDSSIGVAAINAGIKIKFEKLREIKGQDIMLIVGKNKDCAVIGHFPFLEKIKGNFKSLNIFELHPEEGDIPADKIPEFLPYADVVAITGMTITNHTFEDVIKYVKKDAFVIMLGPSTPISEILFDYNVDAVCGSIVEDEETFITYVKEGVCVKNLKGLRQVAILKENYDRIL